MKGHYFIRGLVRAICASAILATPAIASAASIQGQLSTTTGTPVVGVDVRLWAPNAKGWSIVSTVQSDSVGQFAFNNVDAGDYKVDARGATQDLADMWYDVEPPNAGGLVGEEADVITLADTSIRSNVVLSLPATGGIEGRFIHPSVLFQTGVSRLESMTDYRYHHNTDLRYDATYSIAGAYYFGFRGMIESAAGHNYRLLNYEPRGRVALGIVENLTVTKGMMTAVSGGNAMPWPTDPLEPNNSRAAATAISSLPYQSADANVRFGDVDWYCLTAAEGDRFIVRADTTMTIGGQQRKHPWLDPILGFFDGAGTELQRNDDETPRAGYEPKIDTGILAAGDYCFVVSTFGDANFTGGGQSSGGYTLEAEMGNRWPTLTVTQNGTPLDTNVPLNIDEGGTLTVDMAWGDPDGDMPMVDVTVTDVNGNPVSGTFTNNGTDGSFEWTPSQTAAADGPYTMTISVTDGEFTQEVTVTVTVNMVNVTPTVPILDSPIGGLRVNTSRVELVVQNSTDPDEDALTYEYEVDVGATGGNPEQTGSSPENNSGLTLWTTDPLPDNTRVLWRARANDGNGQSGISAWSEWESFFVDRMNEPPSTPIINKPANNEIVTVLAPRLSVENPVDPENDPVVVRFEVATDLAFENVLAASPDVDVTSMSSTVEWTTEPGLSDGATYFVRAQAEDDLGAASDWSDITSFRIPSMELPDVPNWTGEYAEYCAGGLFDITEVPSSIVVANVDGSGDTVSFQFQILELGNDEPIYDVTVPQETGATTEIPIDAMLFVENQQYRFRIRTVRGEETRDWRDCDLRLNVTDEAAQDMVFTAPEDGTVFSAPTEVGARLQPPYDPDASDQMEVRVCGSRQADFSDCPGDLSQWDQIEYFDGEPVDVPVPEVDYGQSYNLKACALGSTGECAIERTVGFRVSDLAGGTEDDGCGCASSEGNAAPAGLLALAFLFGRFRRRRREDEA